MFSISRISARACKENESQSSSTRRLLELLLEVALNVSHVGQETSLVRVMGLENIFFPNQKMRVQCHLEPHDGEYDDGSKYGGCTVGESHDYRIPEISSKCHKMHTRRCYHYVKAS